MEENSLKESPFQPGHPLNPENFNGRNDIVKNIIKYMNNTLNRDVLNFFITGKSGMGKTSLASYVKDLGGIKYKMVGVHIVNNRITDIESFIEEVLKGILNEISSEPFFEKIFEKLTDYVESVGVFKTKIELKANSEKFIESIKDNFPEFLKALSDEFDDKTGIFIIVDDINGLSENEEFAKWYESFQDEDNANYPEEKSVAIMLIGHPDKVENLFNQTPSFNRIFKINELYPLKDSEVSTFFKESFDNVNIEIDEKALTKMVKFSAGIPTMMQEIGDAVFWEDQDGFIDEVDSSNGIFEAAIQIGKKFIIGKSDSAIYSENYKSILFKMGKHRIISFKKNKFEKHLNEKEKKVFSDFLRKAVELKILNRYGPPRSGKYKFPNMLYPLYFYIINSLGKI